MLKKYHDGDRTVFLRAMQKSKFCNAIRSDFDDKDLEDAIRRFQKIMKLLENSLNKTAINDDDDFANAIN